MRTAAAAALLALTGPPAFATDSPRCLSDCTPRIGIVSAFGAEADLLLAQLQQPQAWTIEGKRFTTGELEGHRVVVVLSGVSIVNSTLVTQQMLDHFRIERLVMSGIAGGVNPANHVGDVTVPDRWAMPMEVFWNGDEKLPSPCGAQGDVSCLGLKLAQPDGKAVPPFALQGAGSSVQTGLFMRETYALNAANAPAGEYRFDYPVDPAMLAVAKSLKPDLQRCGPRAKQADGSLDPKLCMKTQPRLLVGGRGVSAPVFLANAQYRRYLFDTLQAQTFEMETAALAHVAYVNQVPYIAFRSLSDLAGAEAFDADVGAMFASGLAEANEAAVTLAFLKAWQSPLTSVSTKITGADSGARKVKALVISMFGPEAEPWIKPFALDQAITVPGLSPDYPALRCSADDVCLLTTGMGHANAAASVLAVTLDPRLDLRQTYFLIAGIAGIDPAQGTLGSAAWARWLVDVGIAHEIDAREMPKSWKSGYYGVLTKGPGEKPKLEYRTEVARVDEALLQKALALSKGVALQDSPQAQAYRARYKTGPAAQPPAVVQCDTLGGDTWWHGDKLGQHARDWTKLMTDGAGTYCTTQQEDNATRNALERAAAAGKVDLKRLAVLRTASNFDRPHPGQTAQQSLLASTTGATGGFVPATQNLAIVGGTLVRDIVANWAQWQRGVPAP